MIMVFAWAADWHTGSGYHSQETIAENIHKTTRQLRRLLTTLDEHVARGESPVKLVREPRFRQSGRGRTSDAWRLELTGRQRPLIEREQPDVGVPLNGTNRTPASRLTGRGRPDQADVGVRGSIMSYDHVSDHVFVGSSPEPATNRKGSNQKTKTKARRSKLWHFVPDGFEPTEAHRKLAAELGVDLKTELAKFRDHEFAKPKSDASRAFSQWLRNAAKWSNGRQGRNGAPQRGVADRVKTGAPEWENESPQFRVVKGGAA